MLLLALQTPAEAVAADARLRRLTPTPAQLAAFDKQLARLLKHLDPDKIERHGETHILDFLRETTPSLDPNEPGERYGNVNGKRDLVLHLGDAAASPVAVLIEVKGPKNRKEMLAPDDLNRKAFQQLLLYYLEDRADDRADDFRRLVVTTGFEWYIFDAQDFDVLFWKNAALRRAFRDWQQRAKGAADTAFFYERIAAPHLAAAAGTLRATRVVLAPAAALAPAALADLWRIFGPGYLLKDFPVQRADANTLNQEFYTELLYLMGLREYVAGGVRRIGRCPAGERQAGALLENILYQMDIGHDLGRLAPEALADYGPDPAQQREEVALALCLMWVNRLLFLKLLEGQLLRYHPDAHAAEFRFLTLARLPEYDELNRLFFGVLNRPPAQRPPDVQAAFRALPYLNSSLFQPAPLEEQVLYIRELNDRVGLRPMAGSVLKKKGAPAVPVVPGQPEEWGALGYLLLFLDAFDFGGNGVAAGLEGLASPGVYPTPLTPLPDGEGGTSASASASVVHKPGKAASLALETSPPSPSGRELGGGVHVRAGNPSQGEDHSPKPLLSAAVLGLVFEKINGYRDGSFYTPGFVTMYMARHTLRRAVVRRFTQGEGAARFPELAGCTTWEELRDSFDKKRRPAYAAWFNGLTVLDPAVGSGHFLVSALNELLALKADLKLLLDADGQYLDYTLAVAHDELTITDNDTGRPAHYRVAHYDPATGRRSVAPKHTRLQAALFREKRALMEHALFGVDLNANSVRICRLRLWIELLKHAYYRPDADFADLETLPNLDLNVRAGNSLVSRYALAAPLGQVFRTAGITVERYKGLVHEYFGASGQAARLRLDTALADLKGNVARRISQTDPYVKRLREAEAAVQQLEYARTDLFSKRLTDEDFAVALRQRTLLVEQRRQELADHQQGVFFQQAFEWRFEFPEVLDEEARFRGFDVVLGNPPYIRQEAFAASKPFFKGRFATFDGKADLYVYFVELGLDLLAPGGELSFICPNKWLRAGYGRPLRRWLQATHELIEFVDFGDLPVFAEATTYPAIVTVRRAAPTAASSFVAAAPPRLPPPILDALVAAHARPVSQIALAEDGWNLADDASQALLAKLRAAGTPLGEYVGGKIYYGIKTGYNAAFVINADTRARLIAEDAGSADLIKPFLAGRDVKRYRQPQATNYLLFTRRGINMAQYPAVLAYLEQFRTQLEPRPRGLTGKDAADWPGRKPGTYKWYEVQDSIDYYKEFEKPKIIIASFATRAPYAYDVNGLYSNDKTTIIPSDDLFLLGVLNAAATDFYFKSIGSKLQNAFFEYKPKYLSQLPIPPASAEVQAAVAAHVGAILAARAADAGANTAAAEAAVDALVAACYGLSPAEAALVAGGGAAGVAAAPAVVG